MFADGSWRSVALWDAEEQGTAILRAFANDGTIVAGSATGGGATISLRAGEPEERDEHRDAEPSGEERRGDSGEQHRTDDEDREARLHAPILPDRRSRPATCAGTGSRSG